MSKTRSHRLLLLIAFMMAVITLQAPIMMMATPAAYAESGDLGGGTGGSGGTGGPNGSDWCGPGGTGGWGGHSDHYLAPFPGCYGFRFVSAIATCPVGFDVWRFYGTNSNPTAYTTVSRVNIPNWCQTNRVYRYFLPNPQDSTSQAGGPWRSNAFVNPYGEVSAIADSNGYCGDPRYSLTCFATSDYPTRYLVNGADSLGGTCANLQTNSDMLSKYFTGAYMDPNAGEYQAGTTVRQSFLRLFASWSAQVGPGIALTAINSGNPAPNGAGNGDDIRFNDGIPCSSALDFVTDAGNPDPVLMGECVMPINRLARVYTGGTYAFYNIAYNSRLGASRYTTEYAASAAAQRGHGYDSWRAMIRHEVLTRGGTVGVQVPAQPFAFGGGIVTHAGIPASDRNVAAEAAAQNAFCFRGAASTYSSQTSSSAGIVADSVRIKVNAPDVFQVGGSLTPGSVTTDAAQLMCSGRVCNHNLNPLDPTLASLTYTLDLNGVDFKECSTKRSSDCQYYVEVPAKANANGQKVTGWFYSATNPNQKVEVTLNNVSATQQVYKQETSELTTCLPTSVVGGVGNIDSTCRPITIVQNLKDGPPRAVAVEVNVGGVVKPAVSGAAVTSKTVVGAVGGVS